MAERDALVNLKIEHLTKIQDLKDELDARKLQIDTITGEKSSLEKKNSQQEVLITNL